jgi:hypothetical protein
VLIYDFSILIELLQYFILLFAMCGAHDDGQIIFTAVVEVSWVG